LLIAEALGINIKYDLTKIRSYERLETKNERSKKDLWLQFERNLRISYLVIRAGLAGGD
jgi:hypothetical protein